MKYLRVETITNWHTKLKGRGFDTYFVLGKH